MGSAIEGVRDREEEGRGEEEEEEERVEVGEAQVCMDLRVRPQYRLTDYRPYIAYTRNSTLIYTHLRHDDPTGPIILVTCPEFLRQYLAGSIAQSVGATRLCFFFQTERLKFVDRFIVRSAVEGYTVRDAEGRCQ